MSGDDQVRADAEQHHHSGAEAGAAAPGQQEPGSQISGQPESSDQEVSETPRRVIQVPSVETALRAEILRTPERQLDVTLPDPVKRQLLEAAEAQGLALRTVLLAALKEAGYDVDEAYLVDLRARNAAAKKMALAQYLAAES